jgi:hypothetical protein
MEAMFYVGEGFFWMSSAVHVLSAHLAPVARRRPMPHRFDPVAVQIGDERSVVIYPVTNITLSQVQTFAPHLRQVHRKSAASRGTLSSPPRIDTNLAARLADETVDHGEFQTRALARAH